MEGTVVAARYEVRRHLARGGMADIYLGWDHILDRRVVLKTLRPGELADGTSLERLRREALAVARLQHPGIVHVYDFVHEDDAAIVVMEHVQGRTLAAVLHDEGPLPPSEVARLGASVGSALAYAHAQGVIHRDVTPSNILLTASGETKVADFGIARATGDPTITHTGLIVGTPAYLAPEQLMGGPVDARTDVYSLGVVLYEACCGRRPFAAETPAASAHQRLFLAPAPPRTVRPDVPAGLEAVILEAMSADPDDRYPSARAMGVALQALAAPGPGDPTVGGPPPSVAADTHDSGHSATETLELADMAETAPLTAAPMSTVQRTATLTTTAAQGSEGDRGDRGTVSHAGRPRRRRGGRWALTAVFVLAAGALLGALLWPTGGSSRVTVPDVVGRSLGEAANALVAEGLRSDVTALGAEPNARSEVVAQDPAAGSEVAEGAAVTLVVAAPAPEEPEPAPERDQPDAVDTGLPDGAEREYAVSDAGTVGVARSGDELVVTGVDPRPGWSFDIDKARGKEVKVVFERGDREVEFRARVDGGDFRLEVKDERDD